MSESYNLKIKIVLIGEGAVGKTTLVKSFLKGAPISDMSYRRTIGADIYLKTDQYDIEPLGTVKFNWMIWDLAGQPTFRMVREQYYKGAQAAVAVFDISRPPTFTKLRNWIAELIKNTGGPKPMIIIGNKIDLRDRVPGCLPPEMGEKYAKALENALKVPVKYIEASAINHINVDTAFKTLAKSIVKKYLEDKNESS